MWKKIAVLIATCLLALSVAACEPASVDTWVAVNQERDVRGLRDLRYHPDAGYAAQRWANVLAACGCLYHSRGTYVNWGNGWVAAGEIVGYSYTGPNALVQAWIRSQTHHDVMFDRSWFYAGVGTAYDSRGRLFAVVIFLR
jgi:uncharacterized protein YkwD